jgi:broad specificity phosphatase PhoE
MVDQMTPDGFRTETGDQLNIPNYGVEDATVFYLMRHAEKELNIDNPGLTEDGKARAKKLAEILAAVSIDGVYSTNYNRTLYTVTPTADMQNLQVNSYDHRSQDRLVETLITEKGKHYVVVGHSNSIPNLLNLFQDKKVYPAIDESVYDNFYVVVVNGEKKVEVFELKY